MKDIPCKNSCCKVRSSPTHLTAASTQHWGSGSRAHDPMVGDLQSLTDWHVVLPCVMHDAQTALKWSLLSCQLEDTAKDTYVIIDSLKNSYDLLHAHLSHFIVAHVQFVSADLCADLLTQFWVSLGFEGSILDDLVRLRLRWHQGALQVDGKWQFSTVNFTTIHAIMIYSLRFKRFATSRWCSMGLACRQLLGALALGLSKLVSFCLEQGASEYYLSGAQRLSPSIVQILVTCGYSSFVADAFFLELMVDDRVPSRLPIFKGWLAEEASYLDGISNFTWDSLGELANILSGNIRSMVMAGALACQSFILERVIGRAESYPWKLLQGDVSNNLAMLVHHLDALDDLSEKLRCLVNAGAQPPSNPN